MVKIVRDNLTLLYSTGASMNNMPSEYVLSGSVVSTVGCGLYKTALVKIASGSATSFGTSGSEYYVDWSFDGTGWHGADGTNLSGLSGSITVMNKWFGIDVNKGYPYIRVLLKNKSGSSVSGSIAVLGLKNS